MTRRSTDVSRTMAVVSLIELHHSSDLFTVVLAMPAPTTLSVSCTVERYSPCCPDGLGRVVCRTSSITPYCVKWPTPHLTTHRAG